MPYKAQINLQVGERQKARWERYLVNSGRFSSVSDLIRSSVENEIVDEEGDREDTSPALANDIDELGEELAELREDVAWLREKRKTEVDVSNLADEVLQELEKLPDDSVSVPAGVDLSRSEYKRHKNAQRIIGPHDGERPGNPQTAQALADRLDSKPKRVEEAIEHIRSDLVPIEEVEYQDQTHYFLGG